MIFVVVRRRAYFRPLTLHLNLDRGTLRALQFASDFVPDGAANIPRQRDEFNSDVSQTSFDRIEVGIERWVWKAAGLHDRRDVAEARRLEQGSEAVCVAERKESSGHRRPRRNMAPDPGAAPAAERRIWVGVGQ